MRGGGASSLRREERGGSRAGVRLGSSPFPGLVSKQGDQKVPVRRIQSEVHPRREQTVFRRPWNYKANVLGQILLVVLKGGASTPFVIAPRRQELGGELVVLVPNYLPNEGELPLSNLVPNCGDVEETRANGAVRDSVIDHLGDGDSNYYRTINTT